MNKITLTALLVLITAVNSVFSQTIYIYPEKHDSQACILQRESLFEQSMESKKDFTVIEGAFFDSNYGMDLLSREYESIKNTFHLSFLRTLQKNTPLEDFAAKDILNDLQKSKLFGLEDKLVQMLSSSIHGASDAQIITMDIRNYGFKNIQNDPNLSHFLKNYFANFLGLYINLKSLKSASPEFNALYSTYHLNQFSDHVDDIYNDIYQNGQVGNLNQSYSWIMQLKPFYERLFFALYDYIQLVHENEMNSVISKLNMLLGHTNIKKIDAWAKAMQSNDQIQITLGNSYSDYFWLSFENTINVDLRNHSFVQNIESIWECLDNDQNLHVILGANHVRGLRTLLNNSKLSDYVVQKPKCF
ncbi:hypothetical protein MRY82_00375 [bacterium]|nr:hypothetical protein [bacterium]